jgi:hypothetical protein
VAPTPREPNLGDAGHRLSISQEARLTDAQLETLLAAGGIEPADLSAARERRRDWLPRFRSLSDPRATDELARALAERLEPLSISRIVVWDDIDDVLLAFVIANHLGCAVTRAWNSEGLLEVDIPIGGGDRVAVLGASFENTDAATALRSLTELRSASVIAVATLVETAGLSDLEADAEIVALLSTVNGGSGNRPQG